MSKWKDEDVTIIQMVPSINHYGSGVNGSVGLGNDTRLYIWDYNVGKWLKGWDSSND